MWSYDGADWSRVDYSEGSKHKDNLYSTQEWTETELDGRKIYRGKWGHVADEESSTNTVDACTGSDEECKNMASSESSLPALFVTGGTLESGPMVNDVFVSERGSK